MTALTEQANADIYHLLTKCDFRGQHAQNTAILLTIPLTLHTTSSASFSFHHTEKIGGHWCCLYILPRVTNLSPDSRTYSQKLLNSGFAIRKRCTSWLCLNLFFFSFIAFYYSSAYPIITLNSPCPWSTQSVQISSTRGHECTRSCSVLLRHTLHKYGHKPGKKRLMLRILLNDKGISTGEKLRGEQS